ncbi:DinB family protein [Paenibacillus curdlanolyticus YK9]|uniref:DinB family protein n=1 Tax=Paenibacillus curdlanolyticus YK9 TaxID=717606 RepID=E0I881_9BACL|nr:DinB family protein [Paenibacillus curdlanolyticus]EFM11386.1 DinB family protein [Paenibacillus curdlanolyticus YK9]
MFTNIQNFIEEYTVESNNTYKLLQLIKDEALQQRVTPEGRTLGFLAWHLVPSHGIFEPTGLQFDGPPDRSPAPESAETIARTYLNAAQSLLQAIQTQLTDEDLQRTVTTFNQPWKIGYTLSAFLKHEVHHRGQLTILMRQAGLPIIGLYGPTKEEWKAFGMPAPV